MHLSPCDRTRPSLVKNPSANAEDLSDVGLTPGLGRSPGEINGNPLQYSYLENSMERRAWRATVHGVAKSRTQLSTDTYHLKETLYPGAVTHSSFSPPSAPEPWVYLLSPPTCLFWTFHTNGLHTLCGLLLGLSHLTSFQGCNMGQCFILLLTK